jgi:hypothetical protein
VLTAACLAGALAACASAAEKESAVPPGPVKVEVRRAGEEFQLVRGGESYRIRGAVYWANPTGRWPLADLKACGGNSVRCGGGNVGRILDAAHRLGMTATVNLRMKMEAVHGFDYGDAAAVRRQFDGIRARVLELKDHPALLMWGVGNELSMGYKNHAVWDAVNDVCRMIHEEDGNHPALTTIGGGSVKRGDIAVIRRRCPDLDVLGINYYAGIETVPRAVRDAGWDRPYVITEWGPTGAWQVPRTDWKAAIEETSTEKAAHYLHRYRDVMIKDAARCLGSYAFIWSSRRERTHTWYGMFLDTGERTGAVDSLQYLWTGRWPASRAPAVEPATIDGHGAADSVTVEPGSRHRAAVAAKDPDGDALAYEWEVLPEVPQAGYAGMGEKHGKPIPGLVQDGGGAEVVFTAPREEGAYRLFVTVRDGRGSAATANVPFYVKAKGAP